jgi:hypothetical protein
MDVQFGGRLDHIEGEENVQLGGGEGVAALRTPSFDVERGVCFAFS